MDIDPNRHHAEQGEGGRAVFVASLHQRGGPHRQQRERKQMRPRQQASRHAGHRESGDGGLRGRAEIAAERMAEHEYRRRGRSAEQEHEPAPSARLIGKRHQDLGQPFMGVPGRAALRVGERIGEQDCAVRQHPRARGDMQERVAVVQHLRREERYG